MATLDNPYVTPNFTKTESSNPEHWAIITSVLAYLQVSYDLTKLFGAHTYVTVNGALAVSKKPTSHNHQMISMYNFDMAIWQAANVCQEKLKLHVDTLFQNAALDLC